MEQTNHEINQTTCPFSDIQQVIRGKWVMVIIYFLSQGTLRFGELSKRLPQVTQANLTKELRELETAGLVHREVYPQVPPKVEYSLTPIGHKFMPVIQALESWFAEYQNLQQAN